MAGDITNTELLAALTNQLGVITDNMATKKDVREIVRAVVHVEVSRLERKVDSNTKVINRLDVQVTDMRKGLAQAIGLAM
jgi:hypothetical protein